MSAIKLSWHAEQNRPTCSWTEAGQQLEYKLAWLHEMERDVQVVRSAALDFSRPSRFGGSKWFATIPINDLKE